MKIILRTKISPRAFYKRVTRFVVANCIQSVRSDATDAIITKYEAETVVLSCYTNLSEVVEWRVFEHNGSRMQQGSRLIYATSGLVTKFERTRRYSIRTGNGYYNLTITDISAHEAGEYVCVENGGYGPEISTVLLIVRGELIYVLFFRFPVFYSTCSVTSYAIWASSNNFVAVCLSSVSERL
jgi:hypothetical protein